MDIPQKIRQIIGSRPYTVDKIGMSGARIVCFDDMVLKIEKQNEASDNERIMTSWLSDKLPAPKLLCSETKDNTNYLLMSKIEGRMLCSPEFLENPAQLIKLLAEGLRMLWSVDITGCPYENSAENKLRLAQTRVCLNLCDTQNAEPGTYGKTGFNSPAHLLEWLKRNKPMETFVFSHGDLCLPNIFAKDNKISGFVDLGSSGIADKYQDVALCYRSIEHNFNGRFGGRKYNGFFAEMLFEELDIVPDWDKLNYYILLDELF